MAGISVSWLRVRALGIAYLGCQGESKRKGVQVLLGELLFHPNLWPQMQQNLIFDCLIICIGLVVLFGVNRM